MTGPGIHRQAYPPPEFQGGDGTHNPDSLCSYRFESFWHGELQNVHFKFEVSGLRFFCGWTVRKTFQVQIFLPENDTNLVRSTLECFPGGGGY